MSLNRTSNSTTTTVNKSNSSVTLLVTNHLRRAAFLYNDSNKSLYLKFGPNGSSTDYTVKIPPNTYFPVPDFWFGELSGAWDSGGSGKAYVTECLR